MKKQTAVEWLWNEIDNLIPYQDINKAQQFNKLLEQAKAMEQEQIKDAVIYGLDEDGHTGYWKISVAQKYYNEKHLLSS
jgi:hypothetical protein